MVAWYDQHFGYRIEPYGSVEDAIKSWSATAPCVGVRYGHGKVTVYAPYGLADLLGDGCQAKQGPGHEKGLPGESQAMDTRLARPADRGNGELTCADTVAYAPPVTSSTRALM